MAGHDHGAVVFVSEMNEERIELLRSALVDQLLEVLEVLAGILAFVADGDDHTRLAQLWFGEEFVGAAEEIAIVPLQARADRDPGVEQLRPGEKRVQCKEAAEGMTGEDAELLSAIARLDGRDQLLLEEIEKAIGAAGLAGPVRDLRRREIARAVRVTTATRITSGIPPRAPGTPRWAAVCRGELHRRSVEKG